MYIYRRIKDLREDHEMTQTEIAAILGTTQRQYSRWETGNQEFPAHHIITLAKYYKVTTDYLLGLSNDPHKNAIKNLHITKIKNSTNHFNF